MGSGGGRGGPGERAQHQAPPSGLGCRIGDEGSVALEKLPGTRAGAGVDGGGSQERRATATSAGGGAGGREGGASVGGEPPSHQSGHQPPQRDAGSQPGRGGAAQESGRARTAQGGAPARSRGDAQPRSTPSRSSRAVVSSWTTRLSDTCRVGEGRERLRQQEACALRLDALPVSNARQTRVGLPQAVLGEKTLRREPSGAVASDAARRSQRPSTPIPSPGCNLPRPVLRGLRDAMLTGR